MVYLTKVVETYRADTEDEAQTLINDAREESMFELTKFTSDMKEVKSKGEVIDTYYLIGLTKVFTNAKDPDRNVKIEYNE